MDDEVEERKPFEDEPTLDQDEQEVPDEILEFATADNSIWLVKVRPRFRSLARSISCKQPYFQVPKFLMQRWQGVPANVHLATMRVYNNEKGPGGKTRISLLLPDSPRLGDDPQARYDTGGLAQEYELDIVKQEVDNQFVISERGIGPIGGRASKNSTNSIP
jgi:hypothetical protein